MGNSPQFPQGPSFFNQGYDSMYNPMGSFGFGSPMNFMMSMMQTMMGMMMMGGMGMMGHTPFPGPAPAQNAFPNPNQFWNSSNGSGHQYFVPQGSDSQVYGRNYSNNFQHNVGGHALQTNHSGYGTNNTQMHSLGYSQQWIESGARSTNSQIGGYNAQQTLRTGYGSRNEQLATGSSSQALITGSGSVSKQITTGGPGSRQALKSGSGSVNHQVGADDQFARTGNNSGTLQVNGKVQEVVAGNNNNVVQVSDVRNNATQKATVGEGSNVSQAGGLRQEVKLEGPNSNVAQQGTGGTYSSVEVKESKGTTMTYETNGTTGNTWGITYGDESQDRRTTITADLDNNTTLRNLGAGDDTQRIRFTDPKRTGDVILNGEQGDDTFKFENMPQDPDARYVINGGTGNNRLELPSGNFTLTAPDGTVLKQVGEGGPSFTVSNLSQVTWREGDKVHHHNFGQ